MNKTDIIINFAISLISGTIGGFIVWLFQKRDQEKKENQAKLESFVIKARNVEKEITSNILRDLRPGTSIEMMKEMLGVPTKKSFVDFPIFSDGDLATTSYLYSFKNANLKITSEDNVTIDSITIFPFDLNKEKFTISEVFLPFDFNSQYLNDIKIDKTFIENTKCELIRTRIDNSFAIQHYSGSPLYLYYTFFGTAPEKAFEFYDSKDNSLFIGGEIDGICISSSEDKSFFIYHYELF